MDAMAAERGIDPGLDVRINPLALVDLRDDFEAQQECGRLMGRRFVQAVLAWGDSRCDVRIGGGGGVMEKQT